MAFTLTAQDHDRIAAAIAAAETATAGEILCTLSAERHRYVAWLLALAAVAAFTLPAIATLLGFGPAAWATMLGFWQAEPLADRRAVELYVAAQAAVLLLATLALWWSPLAQRLAPLALRQDRVHEIALKQFLARGIHLTRHRTGVLLHVSVEDHVVEVIADAAVYGKVSPDAWADATDALLAGMAAGRPADGFVEAIGLVGAVLAAHFPPDACNPDELPNRLLIL